MLLNAEQLHFQFTPSKKVLDGVSFAFETGKVNSLIGSNGAGKDALFNLLSGFLQPQSGLIRFGGKETKGWPLYRLNRLGISLEHSYKNCILKSICRLLLNIWH